MEIFYRMGIYRGGTEHKGFYLILHVRLTSHVLLFLITTRQVCPLLDTHEAIWFFYAHSTCNTWCNVLWFPVATHQACPAICAQKELYFLPLPSAGHGRFLVITHSFVLMWYRQIHLEPPCPFHMLFLVTLWMACASEVLRLRRTCGGPGRQQDMQCGQSMGMYTGDACRGCIPRSKGGIMTFCLCNVKIFSCLPIYLLICLVYISIMRL